MKEKAKRLLVLVLTFSMVFSMFPSTAWATTTGAAAVEDTEEELEVLEATTEEASEEETEETEEAEEEEELEEVTDEDADEEEEITVGVTQKTVNEDGVEVDTEDVEDEISSIVIDDVTNPVLLADDDTDIDELIEDDVQLQTVKEEAEAAGLTEEETANVVAYYNQYLTYINSNPQYLGRQAPYLLSKNDDEDDLGILGSMLVIAGYTVDDVRNGNYDYTSLMGTIQIFYYGNYYGINYYGDTLLEAKDDALQAVEDSGASTEAQKLLVLNDWLAHNAEFDMAYIMNQSGDLMSAEEPEENVYYDAIYQDFYDTYYKEYYNQYYELYYAQYYELYYAQYYDTAIDDGVDTDGDGVLDIQPDDEEAAAAYADSMADYVADLAGQEAGDQAGAAAAS
ncbi:MAG: hypothetical protein LUF92_17645 [Clostridiales bacterium]|nr:hypothetical protein [Clostridiales bacterium]